MDWVRILAFVTGTVDQQLLARIEYLAAENRILKALSFPKIAGAQKSHKIAHYLLDFLAQQSVCGGRQGDAQGEWTGLWSN